MSLVGRLAGESGSNGHVRSDRFRWLTAAELDSGAFAQRYLIEHVLVEAQPSGICGRFKTLKTSIALDLGLSLATGRPFLDHFRILKRAPFAFMCGESGLRALQETSQRICRSRGWSLKQVEGFHLTSDLPNLDSPADLHEIRRFIVERDIKVLAIDPAYLCMDVAGDAMNLFAMGHYLRPLGELCLETGCAPLVVHHNKHTDRRVPAELSDIAFSGFAEFFAQWILLARRRPFDAERGHNELWMSVGGRAGHCGLYGLDVHEGRQSDPKGRVWEASVRDASEIRPGIAASAVLRRNEAKRQKQTERANAERDRIFTAFGRFPDGETKSQIRETSRVQTKPFNLILEELLISGSVEKCQVMKSNNQPYDGYRLTRRTRIDSDNPTDPTRVHTHSDRST
jgi:hypothetical protein